MAQFTFDMKLWLNATIEADDLGKARDALGAFLDTIQAYSLPLIGHNINGTSTKFIRIGLEPEEGDEPDRINPEEVTEEQGT